jgi:DNA-binding NtrC family response regulator
MREINVKEPAGKLLAIIELGGYPNFTPLYEKAGYEVVIANSMRKALSLIRTHQPEVIITEFNYQSDFRDRTSNLESLLAVVQRLPKIKVIVFYEKEYAHQFKKLQTRFPIFAALAYPIQEQQLEEVLQRLR